ncbi:hypothetical protein [Streptomyces sp. NPDC046197]|uniref:hypothetical protein n=1 Tax=Streptomyces sp. NPDC046197 TaxID=3154337 RepID=UPI0033C114ED
MGTSHLPLTAVCVALAGAGCPPLEGGLRSLWHAVLPDAAHVRTAYTLDSSTQGLWRGISPRRSASRGLSHGMRPVTDAISKRLQYGWRSTSRNASWLAGALPAMFSAAGLLGGVLFARFQPTTAPRPCHLLLLGTVFAACWLPLLAPLPAPAVLALAMLPGALFVALLTVAGLTVTSAAPPGTSTEAVGWTSSAIRLGLAGGTALAGPLGGYFAVPLTAAALCALLLSAPTTPAAAPAAV